MFARQKLRFIKNRLLDWALWIDRMANIVHDAFHVQYGAITVHKMERKTTIHSGLQGWYMKSIFRQVNFLPSSIELYLVMHPSRSQL